MDAHALASPCEPHRSETTLPLEERIGTIQPTCQPDVRVLHSLERCRRESSPSKRASWQLPIHGAKRWFAHLKQWGPTKRIPNTRQFPLTHWRKWGNKFARKSQTGD